MSLRPNSTFSLVCCHFSSSGSLFLSFRLWGLLPSSFLNFFCHVFSFFTDLFFNIFVGSVFDCFCCYVRLCFCIDSLCRSCCIVLTLLLSCFLPSLGCFMYPSLLFVRALVITSMQHVETFLATAQLSGFCFLKSYLEIPFSSPACLYGRFLLSCVACLLCFFSTTAFLSVFLYCVAFSLRSWVLQSLTFLTAGF